MADKKDFGVCPNSGALIRKRTRIKSKMEGELNLLKDQVNNLENRVAELEKMIDRVFAGDQL